MPLLNNSVVVQQIGPANILFYQENVHVNCKHLRAEVRDARAGSKQAVWMHVRNLCDALSNHIKIKQAQTPAKAPPISGP